MADSVIDYRDVTETGPGSNVFCASALVDSVEHCPAEDVWLILLSTALQKMCDGLCWALPCRKCVIDCVRICRHFGVTFRRGLLMCWSESGNLAMEMGYWSEARNREH